MCVDAAEDSLGETDRSATGPGWLTVKPWRQLPCPTLTAAFLNNNGHYSILYDS